ncbi:MAG TPA: HNH endonuclease signature motif containing protein, partial [Aldersonia sp.]
EVDAAVEAEVEAETDAAAEAEVDIAVEVTDEPLTKDLASPTDTDPAPAPGAEPAASPVESELRTRLCHPRLATFVARGSRHRSGYLPSCAQAPKPILVPVIYADLYDQFVELLATCPEFAAGIHPDGHGGLRTPPLGALTYRPSAETAALVRARDRHCRFPGCNVPAARCQLDHIRAFDHNHPEAGGWTIRSNLQCLCAFHHELKTVGLWHARALPGMAILWTGPRGDRHLTLPAGGLTPVPAANDLAPGSRGHRLPAI